jgi:hypothetical protein
VCATARPAPCRDNAGACRTPSRRCRRGSGPGRDWRRDRHGARTARPRSARPARAARRRGRCARRARTGACPPAPTLPPAPPRAPRILCGSRRRQPRIFVPASRASERFGRSTPCLPAFWGRTSWRRCAGSPRRGRGSRAPPAWHGVRCCRAGRGFGAGHDGIPWWGRQAETRAWRRRPDEADAV